MKTENLARVFLLLVACASTAWTMDWHPSEAVDNARLYHGEVVSDESDGYNTYGYDRRYGSYDRHDCANFASQCLIAGCRGAFCWLPRYPTYKAWDDAKCKPPIWLNDDGCAPKCGQLLNWLTKYMDFAKHSYPPGSNLPFCGKPGDLVFFGEPPYHVGVIDSVDGNGNFYYSGHTTNRWHKPLQHPNGDYVTIVEIAQTYDPITQTWLINGCRQPKCHLDNDSTFKVDFGGAAGSDEGYTTNAAKCCWQENLANTWPWYSDSTAYACLSWPESTGTVLDSMISPRMNFVGDSAIEFRQSTYSTLQHVSGTTIAVKGSTDNGATWPYVLGDDALTDTVLPWASDQRNVRIAWIFKGPPQTQPPRAWCVDDIEIWAKPTRNRDVSVSGVARPFGIVSQGQTIVPAAMVWNHGKQPETLAVTMNISPGYSDMKSVMLYPYNDTLLEFNPWTATVGSYAATAFCGIDSDECRANDTASLSFRVADEEEDA